MSDGFARHEGEIRQAMREKSEGLDDAAERLLGAARAAKGAV